MQACRHLMHGIVCFMLLAPAEGASAQPECGARASAAEIFLGGLVTLVPDPGGAGSWAIYTNASVPENLPVYDKDLYERDKKPYVVKHRVRLYYDAAQIAWSNIPSGWMENNKQPCLVHHRTLIFPRVRTWTRVHLVDPASTDEVTDIAFATIRDAYREVRDCRSYDQVQPCVPPLAGCTAPAGVSIEGQESDIGWLAPLEGILRKVEDLDCRGWCATKSEVA